MTKSNIPKQNISLGVNYICDGASLDTGNVSEPIETADPLMDELGEYDFDRYEFRVLSAEYDPSGTFVLFDTPEETGEVLIDSLTLIPTLSKGC